MMKCKYCYCYHKHTNVCDRTVLIYSLTDPRDRITRYVGRTTQGLAARLKAHMNEAKYGGSGQRRIAWLKELMNQGLVPEIRLLERASAMDPDAEQKWIDRLIETGSELLNDHAAPGALW